jgi:Flp pilus assembly pilin Flp
MTPAEWGLLFGIIAHSVAVIMALVKLVTWVTSHITVNEQRVKNLEYQVNNDIAGRRVVAEVREDVAAIKAQIVDIHEDIRYLRKHGKA